ncbi:hypothetical protein Goklo_017574, partial [Gossypium klotzschianum]|nr:hypothetical protein [Gossypium klotzschianum]
MESLLWKRDFLIRWRIMRLSKPGLSQHSKRKVKQLFYSSYGDLPYLLDIKVDKHLFRALAQFWNPAYSCLTFGRVDLVPTVEEYMAL